MVQRRYVMVIDVRRCTGCHACSVACKAENAVPLGVFRTWVKQVEKGTYPTVTKSFLPIFCNQCEKPICLQNCPTRATYQRQDGIVVVDEHRCIGCKYCMASCPFDVRYVNPLKQYVQKCDLCAHRLDAGLEPACVETCPGGALHVGDREDPNGTVAKLISGNAVQVLKPEMGTQPQVYYIGADEEAMHAKGLGEDLEQIRWGIFDWLSSAKKA